MLWHRWCFPVTFGEISKNTFSYITPLVAASEKYFFKNIKNIYRAKMITKRQVEFKKNLFRLIKKDLTTKMEAFVLHGFSN